MSDRRKMSRLAIASFLAAAVAAPAASAMPIGGTVTRPARTNQDLRTEGSIAPSRAAAHARADRPDLRSENTADPSRAPQPPVGMPTWPVDPKPLVAPSPQRVAGDGDGGAVQLPIAMLVLTGALALAGGLALAGRRLRTQTGPAH